MRGRRASVWFALTACALGLSACVVAVEERPPRAVYVAGPPPHPLGDVRPGPATPGAAWIDGYWHWNGVHYVWIPGHWEAPPPGLRWVPPSYQAEGGRWVYRAGRWEPVPPP